MSGSPTEHFEHAEHAEHVAHLGDSFMTKVSITIAVLAVVASAVSSLETIETSGITVAKNEAVLLQNKATDNWNFFQAKSLKKNMYEIAAANGGPKAEDYLREAKRYGEEQKEIQDLAKKFEHEAEAKAHESGKHEHRHHTLTIGVTLLHISIAIATLAIITKGQRWPWFVSMAMGALGTIIAASAYVGGH